MKLTQETLKQIVKEELEKTLQEQEQITMVTHLDTVEMLTKVTFMTLLS